MIKTAKFNNLSLTYSEETNKAFRVYNTEQKRWVNDKVYLAQDGELYIIKQSVLGLVKFPLALSQDEFVYHKAIGLQDKNKKEIFEGDFIKAHVDDDRDVIGVVAFVEDLSAYVILCEEGNEFFTLGTSVCEYIEKIGNVFDGYVA